MSEIESLGGALSPEENSFFESGGTSAIPSDTSPADAGATNNGSDGSTSTTGTDKAGDQTGDQGKTADKAPSTVPLAALHEERNKRKATDTEIRALREKVANFEGKFSVLDRLNQPALEKTEPPKIPTVEEDIFGNVRHVGETVAQLQKRLDDQDAAKEASTKAETERTIFVNNYKSDAEKFKATAPDFMDGYNFLLNSRAAELRAIGYDTPEALHNALVADEYAIADMAFKKGKSPAEMLYALAQQRGYKKAEDPAPVADTGKGAEKLATIERGQAVNKSLSNTGGSSGDPEMTAAALIAMPMDEFEAWTQKNPAKARRIMGG